MKRTLLGGLAAIAASAAFAAPAQAQDVDLSADVRCTKPLVECAFDLAVWAVETGRYYVRQGGDVVDDVCDRVLGTCNVPQP